MTVAKCGLETCVVGDYVVDVLTNVVTCVVMNWRRMRTEIGAVFQGSVLGSGLLELYKDLPIFNYLQLSNCLNMGLQ